MKIKTKIMKVGDKQKLVDAIKALEWIPKRGEVVQVRDNGEQIWQDNIYLTTIEGASYPYVTVSSGREDDFKEGNEFTFTGFKQIRRKEEKLEVKVLLNGQPVSPNKISKETWNNLRDSE